MVAIKDIIGSLAKVGITWMGKSRLAQVNGTLSLPGLHGPVEVIRDRWGIPHLYAENNHDLLFAQGFVHAQDRLWQMEMNRRTAQGRLSEIFGEVALDTDRVVRTFGFNRLGAGDWKSASQPIRQIVSAYCEGVNAFLRHPKTKLPVEFLLLRHQPEPWKPVDTLAFTRLVIWQLSHAWYGEIVRAQLTQRVGAKRAAELEIHYPTSHPTTLPEGIDFNLFAQNGSLRKAKGPFLDRGKGSNAWSISAAMSATGHPILCNDMHLKLQLPALWYEIHLVGGDYKVAGVSLPGAPLVMVGHNEHISWGMTLAFTDCEDLFIERLDPGDPRCYEFKGEWRQAEVIKEQIRVKGRQKWVQHPVTITHHGPIISDVVGYKHETLAIQSMALRPSTAIHGWQGLNLASNWDEFVNAVRWINAPQLNIAYADTDGNIGYWVSGEVPIRARGDGSIPAPGWNGDYEWVGVVPFEEMPHAFNPKAGVIVTCNHRIVDSNYPHFLGNVWMNGYRAERIREAFDKLDRISIADCKRLQADLKCLPAKEFIEQIKDLSSDDSEVERVLSLLRSWDAQLERDSIGGTLYEVVRYYLVRNLLEPALGEGLCMQVMGVGFHPLLLSSHEFYGHDTVTMLRLLNEPDSWWVREAGGKHEVLIKSVQQAIEWLKMELGPEVEDWQWGKIHRVPFEHALGLQEPLDRVFNVGPFPIGGDTDTVCQTAMNPEDPYDNKAWAPSFRQVVDLGDLSNSFAIIPPGQSGQLGSRHYDDLVELWLEGEYHPMLWTREQVEREAESRLILRGE